MLGSFSVRLGDLANPKIDLLVWASRNSRDQKPLPFAAREYRALIRGHDEGWVFYNDAASIVFIRRGAQHSLAASASGYGEVSNEIERLLGIIPSFQFSRHALDEDLSRRQFSGRKNLPRISA